MRPVLYGAGEKNIDGGKHFTNRPTRRGHAQQVEPVGYNARHCIFYLKPDCNWNDYSLGLSAVGE